MRWLVEITDIAADKRLLVDLLARLSITIHVEDDRNYLTSERFEAIATSTEVWDLVQRMHNVIHEVSNSFPDASISFKLGDLYEQKEDGSRNKHVFAEITLVKKMFFSAAGMVSFERRISEEERARLEAEQLEREYQEKLALVSSHVLLAFQDERALKVHRFLQMNLDPLRMYQIYELIEDDFRKQGKQLNSLASKKDWTRFTRSVCHPDVFGDDSRHIISKVEPPPNPMSLSEAQAFISKVANLWFQQKCADANNA